MRFRGAGPLLTPAAFPFREARRLGTAALPLLREFAGPLLIRSASPFLETRRITTFALSKLAEYPRLTS